MVLTFQEEDVQYEEDILRNSFSIKAWLRYIDHKRGASPMARFLIYERALKELPGRCVFPRVSSRVIFIIATLIIHFSYTLWYRYLNERVKAVARLSPIDPSRKEVNLVFERALVFMHKVIPQYFLSHS